jgi:hypothetical protein
MRLHGATSQKTVIFILTAIRMTECENDSSSSSRDVFYYVSSTFSNVQLERCASVMGILLKIVHKIVSVSRSTEIQVVFFV